MKTLDKLALAMIMDMDDKHLITFATASMAKSMEQWTDEEIAEELESYGLDENGDK